jgi:hypothetical protein
VRYCLNNAPRSAPVLGLTLYSVVTNLSTALAPALWGAILDLLTPLHQSVGPLQLDRFGVFYGVSIGLIIVGKAMIRQLPDQRSTATHLVLYHMVTDVPLRTINGLYKALFREKDR